MGNILGNRLAAFGRDEDGAAMMWNLFWSVAFILLAGLAVDTANAHRIRMALQVTADSAALAALAARDSNSLYQDYTGDAPSDDPEARGVDAALRMARQIMATQRHGSVLQPTDITFGSYTLEEGFTPGSGNFARVITRRAADNGNAVGTFFLKVLNVLPSWDVAAVSIAERYRAACALDGVITKDRIDFQSNNTFGNDICLHGSNGIEANQNNLYEDGVIVSMADLSTLVVPGGDLSKNIGLAEALREAHIEPHLANAVEEIIDGLVTLDLSTDPELDYLPLAVAAAVENRTAQVIDTVGGKTLTNKNFDALVMAPGNVYSVSCGGKGTLNLRGNSGGSAIEDVIVVTNCDITFDKNTVVRNAMIATTSTSAKSVQGSSGVKIGAPDNCAPGGGAQILTNGGMYFAAKMEFHGSQLVAAGPVKMAAQVDGLSGTSIQSRGRVDMASNNSLALCDGDVDEVIPLRYYRLVR